MFKSEGPEKFFLANFFVWSICALLGAALVRAYPIFGYALFGGSGVAIINMISAIIADKLSDDEEGSVKNIEKFDNNQKNQRQTRLNYNGNNLTSQNTKDKNRR